ncbi:MAG: O-methyltransferase [Bacteroidales bacterium]|nr:O-methyltransferase [Bacteroidales bacterium]
MNDELIDEYILRHIDAEPERLHRLWRATQLHLLYPRMASGHLQGRMLVMLTRMIQPRRILELGTFSGYSALCLAEGMPDDAVLHTIEVNDEQENFTRPWLEASPWADRIHLHIGDALDIVPRLGEPFDLIYIDADKRHYADYYRLVMPHLNPGGYILADNTLWDGHVVEPEHQHDAQTQGIMAFNDLVAQDKEVEKVILPMRDGLTIIRKK